MGIAADIVLVVLAACMGGVIAHLLKQPLLVGYILGGVLIGPYTGGPTVSSIHEIELLAEIGIALLLFTLGIEVSLKELKPVRWIALVGGPLQILLTTLFGYGVAFYALGFPSKDSIWFGAMISLSSTMVIVKILAGRSSTLASRIMIGILIAQDLAVAPLLIILPNLSESDQFFFKLLRSILEAGGFLAIMLIFGTRIIPKLLAVVVRLKSRELFLVATVALAVGVGYGTYLFGLSFALGAFVAGMVLSESALAHQALSDVAPLRDIFGLLFFASVGMLFDPMYLAQNWITVSLVCLIVITGKFSILYSITRLFGYVNKAPTIVGLRLAQVGEFSFVISRVGLTGGHISQDLYSLMITVTVITIIVSPLLTKLDNPLHRFLSSIFPQKHLGGAPFSAITPDLSNHVVVCGYGRTGQAVSEVLQREKIPFVIVDLKHGLEKVAGEDHHFIWGDATQSGILSAAGVEGASTLVITVASSGGIRLIIDRARMLNPSLNILSRAMTVEEITTLQDMGVPDAVQPEYEAGRELGERVVRLKHAL